jgi:hypothetical protein
MAAAATAPRLEERACHAEDPLPADHGGVAGATRRQDDDASAQVEVDDVADPQQAVLTHAALCAWRSR